MVKVLFVKLCKIEISFLRGINVYTTYIYKYSACARRSLSTSYKHMHTHALNMNKRKGQRSQHKFIFHSRYHSCASSLSFLATGDAFPVVVDCISSEVGVVDADDVTVADDDSDVGGSAEFRGSGEVVMV